METLFTDAVAPATSFTDTTALTSGTKYSYALFAHDDTQNYATPGTATCVYNDVPPVLDAFSFTPDAIDVTGSSQDVTITITVSDPLSGIAFLDPVNFYDAAGHQTSGGNFVQVSGDDYTGTYQATVTFPVNSWRGTWVFSDLIVVDNAGNALGLSPTDLTGAGYSNTVTVTNTNPGA